MTKKAFFLQRLNDHIQYLKKIQATLEGKGEFQGTDHQSCKLGLWLYGEGRGEAEEFGPQALAVFDSLIEPHEQFHDAGRNALEGHVAADATAREAAVTEMMRLSNVLVGRLLSLDQLVK